MSNKNNDSKLLATENLLLNKNPFHLLDVSIEDDLEKITDHYDDAVYDGLYNETFLSKTYQSLTAALPRINAEIRWPIDVDSITIKKIIDRNEIPELESFSALSTINIIAHFFPNSDNPMLLTIWAKKWDELSEKNILKQLNEYRKISGFSQIEQIQVSSALEQLKKEHVQAIIHDEESYRFCLDWLISKLLENESEPLASSSFLMMLVEQGISVMQSNCQKIDENITTLLHTLFDNGLDDFDEKKQDEIVSQISNLLTEWDKTYTPLSICNKRRGVDDYNEIFEILLTLANNTSFSINENKPNLVEMQLSLRILELGKSFISLKDNKYIDAYENQIIKEFKDQMYQFIIDTKYNKMGILVNQLSENPTGFFSDINAGKFSSRELPDSLVNQLYHSIIESLTNNQDELAKEAIFNLLNQLYRFGDFFAAHGKEIALYIHGLREIHQQFPMSDPDKNKIQDQLYIDLQGYILERHINYYLNAGNWTEAYDLLLYLEKTFSYNNNLRDAINEAKGPVKHNMNVTKSSGVNTALTLIGLIVVFIIFIASRA